MVKNRFLAALPADEYARLQPHLEPVGMSAGDILLEPGQPLTQVWFFETGIGSVISRSRRGQSAESAIVGREGLLDISAALGADVSSYQALVQVTGHALTMPAATLRAIMAERPVLRDLTLRYAHTQLVQTSYTALANVNYPVEERLARWLLMCHDRLEGDELLLTHDFLSLMLAVRRPSVTVAMHMIEGERFVQARRARITILDRLGLEDFASDVYGTPEDAYERLIAPLRKRTPGSNHSPAR